MSYSSQDARGTLLVWKLKKAMLDLEFRSREIDVSSHCRIKELEGEDLLLELVEDGQMRIPLSSAVFDYCREPIEPPIGGDKASLTIQGSNDRLCVLFERATTAA